MVLIDLAVVRKAHFPHAPWLSAAVLAAVGSVTCGVGQKRTGRKSTPAPRALWRDVGI